MAGLAASSNGDRDHPRAGANEHSPLRPPEPPRRWNRPCPKTCTDTRGPDSVLRD